MAKDPEAETAIVRTARMARSARVSSPYNGRRREAAERLGVSDNTLGRYERGERDIPMDVVKRMEALYKLPAGYLAYPNGLARGTSPGFPVHGDARDGVLWAAEQMSETVTRLIREARGLRPSASTEAPGLASTDAFGDAPPGPRNRGSSAG